MKGAIVLTALATWLLALQPSMAAETAPSAASVSDPEMKRIFDADQSERSGDHTKIDWKVVSARDSERREQTRHLLAEGRLHTADDFLEAAFVFQHGSGDDYLLAHTLAVVATKKGAPGGAWITAATLDRYLQNHKAPQIYGTQSTLNNLTGEWTNEPYDRDLISDALRRELGVPDLAAQDQKLAQRKAQSKAQSTPVVAAASAPQTAAPKQIKCDTGPIERVFVRATWRISSCDNGTLLAVGGGEPAAIIMVLPLGDKVVATAQGGGDAAEVKVATAAFQAMTPAQVADIITQTKAVIR